MSKLCTLLSYCLIFSLFVSVSSAQDFKANDDQIPGGSPSFMEGEVEIHYDGDNFNAIGAADANFIIAARFTTTQTSAVIGEEIKKVRFYINNPTVGNTATVRIYSAGTTTTPGTEIYSQSTTTTSVAWHEVTLNTPVLVPNADIWVGIQAISGPAGTQFWAGCDAGPHVLDGQHINFGGVWSSLVSLNPALTYNWNIRAVVDEIVPVELTSFTASSVDGNVTLNWQTATETNNQGFEVQKMSNGEFLTIGFINGHGTTIEAQSYSYTEKNVFAGSYSYRLKQVDFNGAFEFSHVVEVDVNTPAVYALEQNYPNPFNPGTKINFSLASESKVTLKIFNVLGQEIATLINGNLPAQSHNIEFDASALNSGVYFYTIEAVGIDGTNFNQTKKMILTK